MNTHRRKFGVSKQSNHGHSNHVNKGGKRPPPTHHELRESSDLTLHAISSPLYRDFETMILHLKEEQSKDLASFKLIIKLILCRLMLQRMQARKLMKVIFLELCEFHASIQVHAHKCTPLHSTCTVQRKSIASKLIERTAYDESILNEKGQFGLEALQRQLAKHNPTPMRLMISIQTRIRCVSYMLHIYPFMYIDFNVVKTY